MKEVTFKKKYSHELKFFKNKETFKEQLLALLEDLVKDLEIEWDYTGIRYDTVMTQKEWKDFSTHPERKPYKSKVFKNRNLEDRYSRTLQIIGDSLSFWKQLSRSKYKESLRQAIGALLDVAIHARYTTEDIRIADIFSGRREIDRDNGIVDPMESEIVRFNYTLYEYCKYKGKDYKKLKTRIDKISKGRISILSEYLSTCVVDMEFRKDMNAISGILSRDKTFTFQKVKMGWKVWNELNNIGIDLETYLKIYQYPKYKELKVRLINFLKHKDLNIEIIKHLKDDLPDTYKKYKKTGMINFLDIGNEEALRKKYPKTLKTTSDIKAMIKSAKDEVYKLLPYAENSSNRNVILNPLHPESTNRAFQSAIKNSKGLNVSTIVMTPRSDSKDRYIETFAHESTHSLHKWILDQAEKYSVIPKGSSQQISHPVAETFSTLVEDQFSGDNYVPYKKKYKGDEFANFMAGYSLKAQAYFTLMQCETRMWFEKNIKENKTTLSERDITEFSNKYSHILEQWRDYIIPIKRDTPSNPFRLFMPFAPDDGLRYIKKYISENPKANNSRTIKKDTDDINLQAVLKKKYGSMWIKNKEARIILHWLLIESGRNGDTTTYASFVQNSDIDKYKKELEQIGLDMNKI